VIDKVESISIAVLIDIIDETMDSGQLEAFVRVARAGNLGPVAAELFLTQPALTARLQRLEREVGGPLFLRSRRGMRLTAAGRAFLPYAERTLETMGEGGRLVSDLTAAGTGALTIGAPPAISTYLLPGLLRELSQQNPKMELSVRGGHSDEVLELVLRDEVQIALIRELFHPELVTERVFEDELVLVCARDHPLALRKSVTIEQIAGERLVLFDRRSSFADIALTLFQRARRQPRALLEMDNTEAAAKMVEEGLGVSLLPRTAIRFGLAEGSLVELHLLNTPVMRRPVAAIYRSDTPLSGPAMAFLELARGLAEPRTASQSPA
jgi:DNA-binding transcriptional LysR family regulator